MSLSSPAETLVRPWGSGDIRVALGVLYGAPVLLLLVAWWLVRTRRWRARRREVGSSIEGGGTRPWLPAPPRAKPRRRSSPPCAGSPR